MFLFCFFHFILMPQKKVRNDIGDKQKSTRQPVSISYKIMIF